jgi:hypothetical protein
MFSSLRINDDSVVHLFQEFNREVQLSFEYLMSANKLHWITVISEYVYVLSVCLQSIVDELMLKKNGNLAKVINL